MTAWDVNILTSVLGSDVLNPGNRELTRFDGLSIDSRTVKPGEVFFAIVGDNNDGHEYVADAFKKGASIAVVNKSGLDKIDKASCGPLFIVEDTHEALLEIAAYIRRHIDAAFAGITGSNGKTTTKEMLHSIAGVSHKSFRSPGNLNNLYGLPISLGMMPLETEFAVFELGISVPGEMSRLASVIKPELAVILNVGPAHLETLGSIENVVKAKFELIDNLPVGAVIVLNADDANIMAEAKHRNLEFIGFGIDTTTNFTGKDLHITPDGKQQFTVNGHTIMLNALGRINVYNALAAIAASSVWGCTPEDWQKGLSAFKPVDLRMALESHNGLQLLLDCYNANPGSVKAALETLETMKTEGRKIAILGDMLELGPQSDALHREIGQRAASAGLHTLFCFGPRSRSIAVGAIDKGMDTKAVRHFEDPQELLHELVQTVARGDLLLFKASRGMKLETIVTGLKAAAFTNN
ncbi:MAG: UDP-N-acetylmuramoyl-tripeptide--D-alanyl-D-alanine ligase [Candidatus Zixiibacteriota bacterium]